MALARLGKLKSRRAAAAVVVGSITLLLLSANCLRPDPLKTGLLRYHSTHASVKYLRGGGKKRKSKPWHSRPGEAPNERSGVSDTAVDDDILDQNETSKMSEEVAEECEEKPVLGNSRKEVSQQDDHPIQSPSKEEGKQNNTRKRTPSYDSVDTQGAEFHPARERMRTSSCFSCFGGQPMWMQQKLADGIKYKVAAENKLGANLPLPHMYSQRSCEQAGCFEAGCQDKIGAVMRQLSIAYNEKMRPLEEQFGFKYFEDPQTPPPAFHQKPIVLLVGPYSAGKTTLVKALLRKFQSNNASSMGGKNQSTTGFSSNLPSHLVASLKTGPTPTTQLFRRFRASRVGLNRRVTGDVMDSVMEMENRFAAPNDIDNESHRPGVKGKEGETWMSSRKGPAESSGSKSVDSLAASLIGHFGTRFVERYFETVEVPSEMSGALEYITVIDSPGIRARLGGGPGQGYLFEDVVAWFAGRCDGILVVLDADKLEVSSGAILDVLHQLRNHKDKLRIILNKADELSNRELLHASNRLHWNLASILKGNEPPRLFIRSEQLEDLENIEDTKLKTNFKENLPVIRHDHEALIEDLKDFQRKSAVTRVANLVRRAQRLLAHLVALKYLNERTGWFNQNARHSRLLRDIPKLFNQAAASSRILLPEIPDPIHWRGGAESSRFWELPRVRKRHIDELTEFLSSTLPPLLHTLTLLTANDYESYSGMHRRSTPHDQQLNPEDEVGQKDMPDEGQDSMALEEDSNGGNEMESPQGPASPMSHSLGTESSWAAFNGL